MKLRAYLALLVLCAGLLVADVVQRTVITAWIKLRPSRRIHVLGRWIDLMARFVMGCVSRLGGARLQQPPRVVPTGPGILIVMNHQSLMDIPLVVRTMERGYPRIVTRARYHRFIPLISHMIRLYQYPVVDPTANPKELVRSVRSMAAAGRASDVPIAIFPEGTRTKDGEIGSFKKRGLTNLLAQRPWTVYVFVADGYWRTAKFKDLLSGMGHIDGRVAHVDTLEWIDSTADPGEFVEALHARLVEGLAELRGEAVEA